MARPDGSTTMLGKLMTAAGIIEMFSGVAAWKLVSTPLANERIVIPGTAARFRSVRSLAALPAVSTIGAPSVGVTWRCRQPRSPW
jgi:hypothetical protein